MRVSMEHDRLFLLTLFSHLLVGAKSQLTGPLPIGMATDVLVTMWDRDDIAGTPALYRNRETTKEGPIVNTKLGKVQGFRSTTCRDQTPYYAFMGMPYAQPPLGQRRFRDPEPGRQWDGIRDATFERPTCHKFMKASSDGSEDCLYLNVYTPEVSEESLRAVMVFIHGGAFLGGSSNTTIYSPDFFIDKDVLLVIFNYRLGPLGFLSLQNEEVPGNAGLKDQVMALRWVKENIRSFGGNPDKITIFGESAGSASVCYHVISKSSAGLFHRAIMESGTVISPWAYTEPDFAERKAINLAERIGCVPTSLQTDKDALLRCLQAASANTLVTAQTESLTFEEVLGMAPFPFLPTKEPPLQGGFLTKTPWEHLSEGDFNQVPLIIGSNSAEGLMILPVLKKYDPAGVMVTLVGQDMKRMVPQPLRDKMTSNQWRDLEKRMRKFYFNDNPVTPFSRRQALDMITDVQFLWQIQLTTLLFAQQSAANVYNYYFTFDGAYGLYKANTGIADEPGVCHADELGYLFTSNGLRGKYHQHQNRQRSEEVTIDVITKLWSDFAKTGNPTPRTDELIKEVWKPFKSTEHNYYDIGDVVRAGRSLQTDHVQFWDEAHYQVLGIKYFAE